MAALFVGHCRRWWFYIVQHVFIQKCCRPSEIAAGITAQESDHDEIRKAGAEYANSCGEYLRFVNVVYQSIMVSS
jgi:hypothetical protein